MFVTDYCVEIWSVAMSGSSTVEFEGSVEVEPVASTAV